MKNICESNLVIAEIADWIFPEMGIVEGEHLEFLQPVEIKRFLKRADFVAGNVQVLKRF